MNLTLFKNTGITRKDTILFKSDRERKEWLNKKNPRSVKSNEPFITERFLVNMDYIEALEYDYISYDRIVSGKNPKTMFYFVEDVKQRNEGVVEFIVELDTVSTFLDENFSSIYNMRIDREHLSTPNNTIEPLEAQEITEFRTPVISKTGNELFDNGTYTIVPILITANSGTNQKTTAPVALPHKMDFYLTYGVIERGGDNYDREVHYRPKGSNVMERLVSIHRIMEIADEPSIIDISVLPVSPVKISKVEIPIGDTSIHLEFDMADFEGSMVTKIGDIDVGTKPNSNITRRLFKVRQFPKYTIELETFSMPFSWDNTNKVDKTSQYTDITLEIGTHTIELDPFMLEEKVPRFEFNVGVGVSPSFNIRTLNHTVPLSLTIDSEYSVPLITDEFKNYMKNEKFSRQYGNGIAVANAMLGVGKGLIGGAYGVTQGIGDVSNLATRFVSEHAKLKDLKQKTTSTQKTSINLDLLLKTGDYLPRIIIKYPNLKEKERITEFFNNYGYSTHRYGKPSFIDRDFNYIQGGDITFNGNIPVKYRNDIEERFNTGIKFWKKERFLR